jgi:hypothetical protein
MKLQAASILVFAIIFSYVKCANDIAGNTSETGNSSVIASLYKSDGSPAAGVTVYIRPQSLLVNTPTVQPVTSTHTAATVTDINGKFSFDTTIDTGIYAIEAASGNDAVFIDSVIIINPDSTRYLPPATLRPVGALKGCIQLPEGGDPRKVFILASGLNRFASVRFDGSFLFENLAEAKYDLRIISSLDDYETLDTVGIIVKSAEITDLDTIRLHYSGIPTPKNFQISYDTMLQIVTLRWSCTDTTNVKSYTIYRRNAGLNALFERLNTSPVTEMVYKDQAIARDSTYEYLVAAMSPANMEGPRSTEVQVKVTQAYRISDTLFTAGGQIHCLTIDRNGNSLLYVQKNFLASDTFYYKIERFGKQGNFLNSWDIPMARMTDNNFSNKIAVDDSNYIYVICYNYLIKFDSSGTVLQQTTLFYSMMQRESSIFKDRVYFRDISSHKVYVCSTNGDTLFSWGGAGFTDGYFENITSIFCDSTDMIYVTDNYLDKRRLQIFNSEGRFIRSIHFNEIVGNKLTSISNDLLLFAGTDIAGYYPDGTLKFILKSMYSSKVFFDYTGNLTCASSNGKIVHLKRN